MMEQSKDTEEEEFKKSENNCLIRIKKGPHYFNTPCGSSNSVLNNKNENIIIIDIIYVNYSYLKACWNLIKN